MTSDASDLTAPLAAAFIARSRHYLALEYPTKLRRAVRALPPDALWSRANDASNSAGNLVLHLAGNVRQWIVGGVAGRPVERDRTAEFTRRDGPDAEEVLATLDAALQDADDVLAGLLPSDLLGRRHIQARDTTVLEAVYHVVEHFALHTGQIILIAKAHSPGAIQFYEDEPRGLARPIWREESR